MCIDKNCSTVPIIYSHRQLNSQWREKEQAIPCIGGTSISAMNLKAANSFTRTPRKFESYHSIGDAVRKSEQARPLNLVPSIDGQTQVQWKKIGPTVFPSISFVFCSFDCVCVIVKELFVCNENENSLRFLLFLKKIHTRSRCVFFPNFKFDCFSLSDCFSSLFHSLVYFSCSSNERNNFLTCIPFVTSLGSSK